MRLRNWLLFLLLAFLWGTSWSITKMGLSFVPPMTLLMHQYTIAAIVLFPVFFPLRRRIPRDSGTLIRLLFYSVFCVSQMALVRLGLLGESSGMGAVLTYSQPLFVFCLAIPFLKEKVTAARLVGATMGFAGVCVLFLSETSSLTFDFALIMISSAFLWAVATVYYKKLLHHVDPLATNYFQLLVGALSLALSCLTANSFDFPKSAEYAWIILYSSIGVFITGWSIWLHLLKQEEATVLSGSSFIVPAIALLVGWQVMGETISIESVFGSALVLCGVYLVNSMNRQKRDNHT